MYVPRLRLTAPIFLLLVAFIQVAAASPEVHLEQTPDRGIQPRLVSDAAGGTHLLYFRKRTADPRNREGDLYYRHRLASEEWSTPVRVSSHSFAHLDAIGRADMALDGEGVVHVIWFQTAPEPQYFYTRSNPERDEFEKARALVSENAEGLDAGAAVAARGRQVSLAWAAGDLSKESERAVYTRTSTNNGQDFGPEVRISDPSLGACACCALAATIHSQDGLVVAYRSAINGGGRHMQRVNAEGQYAPIKSLHEWEIYGCPVTTNAFVTEADDSWLVFETRSRVVLDRYSAAGTSDGTLPQVIAEPLQETRQKNPAIAINDKGQMLIGWGEGVSFRSGGVLNLRILDAEGAEIPVTLPPVQIPDYSFPAAAAVDSGFLVLY